MRRAWAVGRKELWQIARDRRTLLIVLFVPVFLLVLYGYALNFDIRHIALAVQDRDGTAESRRLVSAFVNSGYFDFAASVGEDGEIERLMNQGRIRAALVIPERFGERWRTGAGAKVQVIVNGDNANTGSTVVGYVTRIVRNAALETAGAPGARITLPITVQPRIWYNPELSSTLFLVPGLIAFIAMIVGVTSTALSIVREKETGTMEQVRMAPISGPQFIIGKTIPYLALSFVSSMFIVFMAMVLFDLPMRGSWWALLLAVGLFLLGAIGTGLLISTVAESQQIAFLMGLLLTFLPTFILSGFIFPISSMPRALQIITYAVPARYFLVVLRGIVLKGSSLGVLATPLWALVIYAAVFLALASVRLARQHG
jgi:ABC-2 type transport system permease protein